MVKHLQEQKTEADDLRRQLHIANCKVLEANETANNQLESALREEREESSKDRETLLGQMRALMEDSARIQESRMSSRINNTRNHLNHASVDFRDANSLYGQGMDTWSQKEKGLVDHVTNSRDSLKTRMKNDWTAVNEHNTSIQKSTKAVHEETVRSVDAQMRDMANQMEALDEFVTRARSQNDQHHDVHVETLKILTADVEQSYDAVGENNDSTTSRITECGKSFKIRSDEMKQSIEPLEETVRQPLSALRSDVQAMPIADYVPTGETPQKREYAYPTTLPRTQPHDGLLEAVTKEARSFRTSPSKSPTKLASSPSKLSSPSKTRVYNDALGTEQGSTGHPVANMDGGLKEININIAATSASRPVSVDNAELTSITSAFSKSVGGGPPPLKRHATVDGNSRLPQKLAKTKSAGNHKAIAEGTGRENNPLAQSVGSGGGRRLRSSPQG